MRISLVTLFLTLFLCSFLACPQESFAERKSPQEKKRPKIALVLEGGGAKGFAHVGVIKVLQSAQIPVHFVVGTSMGSIVGAAFASGRSVEEMENVLTSTNWDELFNENPPRDYVTYREKAGRNRELFGDAKIGIKNRELVTALALVQGQNVVPLFQELFGKVPEDISFDQLPIPFRAVAANIETGEAVVLSAGSLPLAARASMSVPGFFSPVEINNTLLVDGGITNNLPVDVALAAGADVIIAVECKDHLRTREKLGGPLAISGQILDMLLERSTQQQLKLLRPQDIHIAIETGEYGSTSFGAAKEIMNLGEQAAQSALANFASLALPSPEFEQYVQARTSGKQYEPRIDFLEIHGVPPYREAIIRQTFDLALGEPLDRKQIEQAVRELHRTGEYKRVSYQVRSENGKQGVQLDIEEKEWLKNYFRLGFSLEDNFEGRGNYTLATGIRFRELNDSGAYAEAQIEIGLAPRLFVEYYQPLYPTSPFFIAPELTLSRRLLNLSDENEIIAEYKRDTAIFGLKGGLALDEYGEINAGWRRGPGKLDRRIGEPSLEDLDYDIGEFFSTLDIDQLDNPDFPTRGYKLTINSNASRDSLGANSDFEQVSLFSGLPITVGANTLLLIGELGHASSEMPPERFASFGGFFDISGSEQSSLIASDYWRSQGVLYRRLAESSSSLFPLGGYAGLTFEFSALRSNFERIEDQQDIVSGSVFLGADTPLLPVYLGFGLSDLSERAVYLNIGRLAGRRR